MAFFQNEQNMNCLIHVWIPSLNKYEFESNFCHLHMVYTQVYTTIQKFVVSKLKKNYSAIIKCI